jgi:hypothetical protein
VTRHSEPFNKRDDGKRRRAEKQFKQKQRESLFPTDRRYDDGWFPASK